MAARKPLIAGNWKMYGRQASLGEIKALWTSIEAAAPRIDAVICPPALYVAQALSAALGTGVAIGAQDCSPAAEDAARTGEVSAAMLADVGARYVIVGHSERRTDLGGLARLHRAGAHYFLQRDDVRFDGSENGGDPIRARSPIEPAAPVNVVGDDPQLPGLGTFFLRHSCAVSILLLSRANAEPSAMTFRRLSAMGRRLIEVIDGSAEE